MRDQHTCVALDRKFRIKGLPTAAFKWASTASLEIQPRRIQTAVNGFHTGRKGPRSMNQALFCCFVTFWYDHGHGVLRVENCSDTTKWGREILLPILIMFSISSFQQCISFHIFCLPHEHQTYPPISAMEPCTDTSCLNVRNLRARVRLMESNTAC